MFIKINNDRILNLKNVNTVNIDKANSRIAFNFNYSINIPIKNNAYKTVSGYAYWDFDSPEVMFQAYEALLQKPYVKQHFIKRDKYGIINLNCVTFIHFNDFKRNMVVNLNNAIYVEDDNLPSGVKHVGNFIYLNFDTDVEYRDTKNNLKAFLNAE